jgi:M6 family metalloprotease-like protein
MGTGNYQRQTSPAYMTAWSRYRLGLITPIILDDSVDIEINILPTELFEDSILYLLPMSTHMPQEYLLLENRQKLGSDQYLEKSGLLAWHIDETMTNMYPAWNCRF